MKSKSKLLTLLKNNQNVDAIACYESPSTGTKITALEANLSQPISPDIRRALTHIFSEISSAQSDDVIAKLLLLESSDQAISAQDLDDAIGAPQRASGAALLQLAATQSETALTTALETELTFGESASAIASHCARDLSAIYDGLTARRSAPWRLKDLDATLQRNGVGIPNIENALSVLTDLEATLRKTPSAPESQLERALLQCRRYLSARTSNR